MRYVQKLTLVVTLFLSLQSAFGQTGKSADVIEQRIRFLDSESRVRANSVESEVRELRDEAIDLGYTRAAIMGSLTLAKVYENQKNYEASYACIDTAFQIAEEEDYRELDYMLNHRKGFIMIQQGANAEAIQFLSRGAQIAKDKEHNGALAQALAQLGLAYIKQAKYDSALVFLDSASQVLQIENDELGLQNLYTYMGMYYSRTGDREKAIEQEKISLELSQQRNDTSWMIVNHLNLLSRYAIMGDIENALYHFETRQALIEQIEYPEDRKIELNVGVLYVQSEQYEKALDVLEVVRDYYTKEGNEYRVALSHHWMALAYRGLDNYDVSAQESNMAYQGARKSNNRKLAELSAFTLFQTYHWRGKDTEAIQWLLTSNEIKDSIENEEVQKQMAAFETKYETFRKEQEIEMLLARSETDRVKRNQLWIGLIGSLLIGGLVVFGQINRRKREKELEQEKLRNALLEAERLKDQLHHKEKELASQLLNMAKKNEFLNQVNQSIESIKKSSDGDSQVKLQKVIRTISRDMTADETWESFLAQFKEIHSDFVELMVNSFKLTSNEVRLASMMKMNMTSKEISSLLNISDEGVKKARYRLRKKLGLESDVNIQSYLLGL